eukprot:2394025-Karenia_brevis.AAC.1
MNVTAASSPSLGAMIAKFKAQAQRLTKLVLTEADQRLFHAPKSTDNRLTTLGHTNKLQHTRCQVALPADAVKNMHLALLTIHGRLNKRQQLQLRAGNLQ